MVGPAASLRVGLIIQGEEFEGGGLSLRGASRSFVGGFTKSASGQECGSDTRLKFLSVSFPSLFRLFLYVVMAAEVGKDGPQLNWSMQMQCLRFSGAPISRGVVVSMKNNEKQ